MSPYLKCERAEIRKMTKPSVPSSVGHKEQEVVNDQSSEHIYETDMKQVLKETIDGNENKKGDDGTELDEDSLKASGTINKRRFGRNLLEGPCDGGRRRISHSATRAAPPKRFHVCAQAAFSELAPVSAAVYGTLLLGGGLFACK